ncbi:MAG: NADH-quinone oxidoreductase subunit J [bacterium]|nr:NADH-quinone oxidoreductase subunit J [Candidatus Sumerlaeota bacterium]
MNNLLIFYPAAVVAVITTLMVILTRNPVYAVIYLILSLCGVALVFFSLGAPFLAALEVIVYAGAIIVLFLFVVMMLNIGRVMNEQDCLRPSRKQMILPGFLVIVLLVETLMCLFAAAPVNPAASSISTKALGQALYGKHYLGVLLSALVLLIGAIGGIHLGRASSCPDTKERSIHAPR